MEFARRCSTVGEGPLLMFAVGLFYDTRIGNAKRFPHLIESGPVVTGPLASAVETSVDDAAARIPVAPQAV